MTLPANGNSLPSVQVEEFEGPLDLLLDEVRRQNVAIEKIAMAPIVARFLEYVRTAAERNLNLDIEWLHMAATLIHWKSRSLLPADATGEPQRTPSATAWSSNSWRTGNRRPRNWPAAALSSRPSFPELRWESFVRQQTAQTNLRNPLRQRLGPDAAGTGSRDLVREPSKGQPTMARYF